MKHFLVAITLLNLGCNTLPDKAADDSAVSGGEVSEVHLFSGGFSPRRAPNGGFGGGDQPVERTPIVFLHGNGHDASDWMTEGSPGTLSVVDSLRRFGYTGSELFGLSYLSAGERRTPSLNYHDRRKADLIADFIEDVLEHTGTSQVDVVGHSLGVTMAIHALDRRMLWEKVRKFVGISGAVRGIDSCLLAGFANPAATTCGSQNLLYDDIFGFWPDGAAGAPNPRLGGGPDGFRNRPTKSPGTTFYTIRAGTHDQIVCRSTPYPETCWQTSVFETNDNVGAQIDIGADGGDVGSGVGHMRSMSYSGPILWQMLDEGCRDEACCAGYDGACSL